MTVQAPGGPELGGTRVVGPTVSGLMAQSGQVHVLAGPGAGALSA